MNKLKKYMYQSGGNSNDLTIVEDGEYIKDINGKVGKITNIPTHDDNELIIDNQVKKVPKGKGGQGIYNVESVLSATHENRNQSDDTYTQADEDIKIKPQEALALAEQLNLQIKRPLGSISPSKLMDKLLESREKLVSKYKNLDKPIKSELEANTFKANVNVLNTIPSPEDIYEFLFANQESNKSENNGMYAQSGKNKKIIDFYENYLKSPKYLERLNKSNYENPKQTIEDRLNSLKNTNYKEVNGFGNQFLFGNKHNLVNIDNEEIKKNKLNKESVIAHEYSHSSGAVSNNKFNKNFKGLLNSNDINLINSKNRLQKAKTPQNLEDYGNFLHDRNAHEVKADIDLLRYKLKKDNIYDTGTSDFNNSILLKAKNKYNKDKFINRVFQNFKNKDLIELMNNVAINNNSQLNNSAQTGGEIHIDPEKKGTFKAAASRYGMSMDALAMDAKQNPEKYSGILRKKANFYRNFAMQTGGRLQTFPTMNGSKPVALVNTPTGVKKVNMIDNRTVSMDDMYDKDSVQIQGNKAVIVKKNPLKKFIK